MAIIKTANTTGKYHNLSSYNSVIHYVTRPDKAIHGCIGCFALDPYNPAGHMELVAKQYCKDQGVHIRHFIFGFELEDQVSPGIAAQIGEELIAYLGQQFQALYAVHEDRPHLHIHIIINAVSHIDGHKYRGTRQVFGRFMTVSKRILRKYGIQSLRYVSNRPFSVESI